MSSFPPPTLPPMAPPGGPPPPMGPPPGPGAGLPPDLMGKPSGMPPGGGGLPPGLSGDVFGPPPGAAPGGADKMPPVTVNTTRPDGSDGKSKFAGLTAMGWGLVLLVVGAGGFAISKLMKRK